MDGRRTALLATVISLCASLTALAGPEPAGAAATREPLGDALAAAGQPARAFDSAIRPRADALRSMVRRTARRYASAADEFRISSGGYGPAEVESVAAILRSLDHGPEMAGLSVFVATPEQIREACGAEVVACYFPSEDEMVVSGVDRAVDGVPRDFAIAHEYGHHIANTRADGALPAIEAGPARWATYERVCQLSRRGRLFPGDQGAHYWRNPEEAFAQSYARLNRPDAGVSWQYTPLLRPTAAALAKIHADVARPWSGPVEESWGGSLAAPPAAHVGSHATREGALGVGPGEIAASPPWLASHLIRTPLDGSVTVSVQGSPDARLAVALRDPRSGRVLAHGVTDSTGVARLSFSNCGRASVRFDVRAVSGPAGFHASITHP